MGVISNILEKIGLKKKARESIVPPVASRLEDYPKLNEGEQRQQSIDLAKKAKQNASGIHGRVRSLKDKIIVIGELPSRIKDKIQEQKFLKDLKDTTKEIKGLDVPKVKELKDKTLNKKKDTK